MPEEPRGSLRRSRVDGCGEFMPAGDHGTPESLKCAACDCHRNFHRREVDGETSIAAPPPGNCYISFSQKPPQKHQTIRRRTAFTPYYHNHRPPPVMVDFGGAESPSDDLNGFATAKRFRTKFSADQKEKMRELGKRIGWRIGKENESEVKRICEEVGIKRRVFKVWLHNYKQATKRNQ